MGHHVTVQGSGLGELLLIVPVHLLEDGGLAVDHLVMGQGEQIPLLIEIHHGEGELVVVLGPHVRWGLEIGQGVVHPPQIPLVVKAQPAVGHIPGHTGIGGGVLGNEQGVGQALLEALVHSLQKLDGSPVLPPPWVSLPVDEIAHRIHAQAVHVKLLQPIESRRLEEAPNFPSGVHEVAAAPLAAAYSGVGVLVERSAVVIPQSIVVHRKVHRDKVHDNPNVVLVALVNEEPQLIGGSIAGGGAEKSGVLIPPGGITGVLSQGHQLNIVIAALLHIGDEPLGQLLIGVPVVGSVGFSLPRAQVHLVNVQGLLVPLSPAVHPCPVLERIAIQGVDHRGSMGPLFAAKSVGVAVVNGLPSLAGDAEFVPGPHLHLGDGELPEVPVVDLVHVTALPAVEVSDHRDAGGIGGEGAEDYAAVPLHLGTQKAIGLKFLAHVKSVKVHGDLLTFLDNRRFSNYNRVYMVGSPLHTSS